jgi:ketosteroid isomerase-like protein
MSTLQNSTKQDLETNQKSIAELNSFLNLLEQKYKTQNPAEFVDIINENAFYIFTDGTHTGRKEILKAFAKTWKFIKEEIYHIKDVKWLTVTENLGICSYVFEWSGIIDNEPKSGRGNATNIFVKNQNGNWEIIHEHLNNLN